MIEHESVMQMWQSYWVAVRPPGPVSDVQVQETKRAFMAGCWCMLQGTADVSVAAGTEDEGAEVLGAWDRELRAFQDLVLAGRA